MNIIITDHAAIQAKKRLRFNKATLERMFRKALEHDSDIFVTGKVFSKRHKHMNYVYEHIDNDYILITVTDLQEKAKYKEKILNKVYYRQGSVVNGRQ